MANHKDSKDPKKHPKQVGITKITVHGYKSLLKEQSIEIRPLTLLAGANSSGKSSIIQPLLLLKQTLDATYDPGALLIDGPNVKFTTVNQLLSRPGKRKSVSEFGLSLAVETLTDSPQNIYVDFKKRPQKGLDVCQMKIDRGNETVAFTQGMTHEELLPNIPSSLKQFADSFSRNLQIAGAPETTFKWRVNRKRCFLTLELYREEKNQSITSFFTPDMMTHEVTNLLRGIIHLPGLRGNPSRTYPVTSVGPDFPGTFEQYAASVIAQWQADNNTAKLSSLGRDLEKLGLTWIVTATPINETQVELQVGKLLHHSEDKTPDMVSIADVGFGVSQTLPILVALHCAKPRQLVYLEQPETHLHPRAQFEMAEILSEAVGRGVRVVVETHSSLLLLGLQTLIAENKLSPELVKLHWFKRRPSGRTEVKSADVDEAGAFGAWPEDFSKVSLEAESRYLDASETRHTKM